MPKAFGAKLKNFLRGVGSVIDMQPETRRDHMGAKMVFTRTIFINGRKHQLDAKRDLFTETIKAYQADWKKVTSDVIQVTNRLPLATRNHVNRRLSKAR